MPHCRRMLRDKPRTPLASLKEAILSSRLDDAVEVIRSGEASPQLICACAWRALELLAREVPDVDPNQWFYKETLLDALTVAIELIEAEFPGECDYLVNGCFACEIECPASDEWLPL